MPDDLAKAELVRADGHDLEVLVSGPPAAMPLVFHVGTPMAAVEFEPLVQAAASRGFRTITYSRPGYGRSTRRRGHAVADVASEVRAILAWLGADEFVTLGWSGGGPRAIACAAMLGDRCRGATSLGGVAPYGVRGLDWLGGMNAGNIAEYSAALNGESALAALLEREAARVSGLQTAAVVAWFESDAMPRDAPIARAFAEFVATSFRRSQTQDIVGWLDDDLALIADWGFECGAIRRPVAIWHGTTDKSVPFAHGAWLAEHVPSARFHALDGHDHFSVPVVKLDEILDELAAFARP